MKPSRGRLIFWFPSKTVILMRQTSWDLNLSRECVVLCRTRGIFVPISRAAKNAPGTFFSRTQNARRENLERHADYKVKLNFHGHKLILYIDLKTCSEHWSKLWKFSGTAVNHPNEFTPFRILCHNYRRYLLLFVVYVAEVKWCMGWKEETMYTLS